MDWSGATVYVVDDDDAVRRSLTRLLRAAGRQAEAFATAEAFLERVPRDGHGCVLLDMQMPGMDGLQLMQRMNGSGVELPVVFLTGRGTIPMSVRAMKQGAVDFLVKPVAEEELFRALDAAVARHRLESSSRGTRAAIRARLGQLTAREREVLDGVLRGRLNKQIAYDLGISEKTVKAHRGKVMEKMEAHTVAELVHLCDEIGLGAELPSP